MLPVDVFRGFPNMGFIGQREHLASNSGCAGTHVGSMQCAAAQHLAFHYCGGRESRNPALRASLGFLRAFVRCVFMAPYTPPHMKSEQLRSHIKGQDVEILLINLISLAIKDTVNGTVAEKFTPRGTKEIFRLREGARS